MPAKGLTTKFEVVDSGGDQDAVDVVLTDQLARLHSQVDAATARIAQLEAELAAATACEDAIRLTMIAATKARDELLATARKQVDEMLDKIAEFYEAEVEATVDALTSLIEPILIVFMGIVIGGMVIALYLPMFNIINLIK